MGRERDMGRRLAPVPVRTGTTGEDRADRAAFLTVMSLPALALADWLVLTTVIRDAQCERYQRGGGMGCGGSPAMEEAFTTGILLTFPALAVQLWLAGFVIRWLRNGSRPPLGRARFRRGN
ncbi:hypothetical protein [Streptosporangium sandarakinum]|uniref:Uncharacterized protein n=1 Tax=Streptosporangium sandarakinum TaxID=1260955 RepID=A0A852V821_9ACTN|nr:hypothetical protein [Streptosporangium sandarakinum]NYF43423.1 hypothetical protein [Streptosporangium sandarakinum]